MDQPSPSSSSSISSFSILPSSSRTTATKKYSPEALSTRLLQRANDLEEAHLSSAIDYKLYIDELNSTSTNPNFKATEETKEYLNSLINPDSVKNVFSPFVPSPSTVITKILNLPNITQDSTFLDIGSGDGRVCVAMSAGSGCLSVGLDVSPICVELAEAVAVEEGVNDISKFHIYDCTVFESDDVICQEAKRASVVFLFVHPDLLNKVVEFLCWLFEAGKVEVVVTKTYHFDLDVEKFDVVVNGRDEVDDLVFYSMIKKRGV